MNKIRLKIFIFIILGFSVAKSDENTVIKANKLNKNANNIIKAIGDVEIRKGAKVFNAKEVEYNSSTQIIKSNSNIKVYDEKEDNLFFAEQAEMNSDFLKANFVNSFLIFKNGSNIFSSSIIKDGEFDLKIKDGYYSVCPTLLYDKDLTYEKAMENLKKRKTPLFALKSSSIKADTNKKNLTLYGTSVWFWKIPIFYLPYLKTGLAFKEEITGFDMFGVENTSNYGFGIYFPYKYIRKNSKLILTSKIYEKGNYLVNTKYKSQSEEENKWKFNLTSDIVNDNGSSKKFTNVNNITEEQEGNYKYFRGFGNAEGLYNFNDTWSFDFNTTIASDRYYFRDYYQLGIPYIQSNIDFSMVNLENKKNFNYFYFKNLFYQELLEENKDVITPRYIPILNLHLEDSLFRNEKNNLLYKINFSTTSIFRNTGTLYNRISILPAFNNILNTNFGKINISLEGRADTYILNENDVPFKQYENTVGRFIPQFNVEWKKAFIMKNVMIQPIIKYLISGDTLKNQNKVPNEDSKPNGISFEDIFANNRFNGYDRYEYGSRISYGFELTLFDNFNLGLAQGYRSHIKAVPEKLFGFEDNMSDYVGYISYIFNSNFDIYYRFLINKNNFNFLKNELNLNLNTKYLDVYTIYTATNKQNIFLIDYHQLSIGSMLKIFHNTWKIDFSGTLDLENGNRLLLGKIALIYDGGCTTWEVNYTTYNPLTNTEKSTSINFNFAIKFI